MALPFFLLILFGVLLALRMAWLGAFYDKRHRQQRPRNDHRHRNRSHGRHHHRGRQDHDGHVFGGWPGTHGIVSDSSSTRDNTPSSWDRDDRHSSGGWGGGSSDSGGWGSGSSDSGGWGSGGSDSGGWGGSDSSSSSSSSD